MTHVIIDILDNMYDYQLKNFKNTFFCYIIEIISLIFLFPFPLSYLQNRKKSWNNFHKENSSFIKQPKHYIVPNLHKAFMESEV